ncbi:MAG: YitT family protein [Lachnospiraceae bacterium]|jgi:uncharacterized membrane-anchored protein YitT (DUF2179 family)
MEVRKALKSKNFWKQQAVVAVGCLIAALSYNLIIIPHHLYSGNFTGIVQLIRTLLLDFAHITIPGNFEIMGILLYALNIPLLVLAYRKIGKVFFLKSVITITMNSIFFSVIPVLKEPLISDPLTGVLISGFIVGSGCGMILRNGSSGGGIDIIGIYMSRKDPNFSVGKASMFVAMVIYTICFFLYDFNVDIVVYSVIFTCVTSFTLDRSHYQTIKMSAIIFTKNPDIGQLITKDLDRGYTRWIGKGGYSQEDMLIFYTVVNRYEVTWLKRKVKVIDPHAFISIQRVTEIEGAFANHL